MPHSCPKISVLLPFYRPGPALDEAVGSILSQGLGDFELLLIDNNADPGSREVAARRAAEDARIRLVHEARQGIAHALNAGLAHARGTYIARMDADDISRTGRLEKQAGFLDAHPEIGAVSSQTAFRSSVPKNEGYALFVDWQNGLITHEDHVLNRFVESPLAHPTIMFRKKLIDLYGPYDTGELPEDYELWLRWLDQGVGFYKIPEPLLQWNDHPDRLSRVHRNYSREAFYNLKCRYLARWILRCIPPEKKILVCGSSKIGRKRAALLSELGVDIYGFTDVRHRRNREIRFVPYRDISDPAEWFLVNMISKRGVGEAIRSHFTGLGFREGADFILAG